MYHAICPDCKHVITLNVPGLIWADCPNCNFYGQVPALASSVGPTPRLPLAPMPAPAPPTPAPPTPAPPTPALSTQGAREIAGLDISAFADEVFETLLALLLRTRTWPPLPVAWERLQVALDTLHSALGGTHMGDYAPDADAVGAAIVGVTVAQLVALEAVGRLCGADADGGAE